MANFNRLYDIFSSAVKISMEIVVMLVDVIFKVFLLIGSLISMLLLYKIFPETALILYDSLIPVFKILYYILIVALWSTLILLVIYVCIGVERFLKDAMRKQKLKKKEFMDELIIKLKKEIKK